MYFEFGPTREMSTPVIDFTKSGTLLTIDKTSSVNFAAPISPPPLDTIVIFFACDNGAATSAATFKNDKRKKNFTAVNSINLYIKWKFILLAMLPKAYQP